MLEQQLELLTINAWANKKFRESLKESYNDLKDVATPYGNFQELIFHLFGAVYFWMKRIGYADFEIKTLKDSPSTDELFQTWELVDQKFIEAVKKMQASNFGPEHIFKYKTSKGLEFQTTIDHMILQLNNHCYYHRGQIAYIVREQHKTPMPQTDAIVYFRENKIV